MPSDLDPSSSSPELTRVTPSSERGNPWIIWIVLAPMPVLLFFGVMIAAALGVDEY
jgi:hypothetical protein